MASQVYETAIALIESERTWLSTAKITATTAYNITIDKALLYINYLSNYWLPEPMWKSWSTFGRMMASQVLNIPLDGVIPTTNHLEAFNGVLKHKYIHQYQKSGRCIRIDILVILLITRILPIIYKQRNIEQEYHNWLSLQFGPQIHSIEQLESLEIKKRKPSKINISSSLVPSRVFAMTWWSSDLHAQHYSAAQWIIANQRISNFQWIANHTIEATCASSLSNIHVKGHTRYTLSLNSYRLAVCSCPFNSLGNGACKHLWAFRFILPSLSPPVYFYFPLTEKAALEIYTTFFPPEENPIMLSHSNFSPTFINSNTQDILPPPPENTITREANILNTLSSMIAFSDPDNSDNNGDHIHESQQLEISV
ncbi:hypothetical protein Clacol_004299 [Clathrus columnatus]|uniref:SWIM-type domain-containing protein n=1 Tax=Clathrus columnatus TaxID=1419009 RepID=A0AAV5AA71_9AGAM|nr:hypothetical protein Clacol_004299 [Clathrus columnatus]